MAKVIFEQFDGGLQKDWYKVTSTNRALKNQKKNGIATGCVNPFFQEGILLPGFATRANLTNTSTVAGSANNVMSIVGIEDGNFAAETASIYFGQDDDFHSAYGTTIQNTGWPQTLDSSSTHLNHSALSIDKILDFQVYAVRKQLIFFRDGTDWDCAYYSGIYGQQGTATMTIATPCVVSKSSHRLVAGDVVRFLTTGALPTGLTAGTNYYVITAGLTASVFQISATKGGAAINTSGTQSGTHTLYPGLQTHGMSAATGYSASLIFPLSSGFGLPTQRAIVAVASDNGFAYFGNGSILNKFDGSGTAGINGTVTGRVLELSNNREIFDMVDGLGKIWILTRTVSKSGATSGSPGVGLSPSVVVWNRQSTTVGIDDNIPINAVDVYGIYIYNGIPYVWGKSHNGVNKLFVYTGRTFEPIAEIGLRGLVTSDLVQGGSGAEIGVPAMKSGSITSYAGGMLWGDAHSNMFWYGSINPGIINPSVYWIARLDGTTASGGGAIFVGGSTSSGMQTLYGSHLAITTINMSSVDLTDMSQVGSGITVYTSAIELPKLSTIKGVTIFFNENANADTGTTTVKVYNSWKKASGKYLVTKSIDHDVDIPRGWVYFPMDMENSNLVQLSFTYNGTTTLANSPQITRIEVDYVPTNKLL